MPQESPTRVCSTRTPGGSCGRSRRTVRGPNVQQSLDGSPIRAPVFRGHYTVDGPILVAITEFPPEYRDAGLRYRWALDNGQVRFELLNPPDPIAPVIVSAHPWTAGS